MTSFSELLAEKSIKMSLNIRENQKKRITVLAFQEKKNIAW